MNKTLEQKRGLNLRKHTLFDDYILVETKTIQKYERYEVKLDQIGWEKFYKAEPILLAKIFFYLCLALPSILTLMILLGIEGFELGTFVFNWVLWSIFALLLYYRIKNPPDDVYLTGGQRNLLFYRAVPNEADVTQFLNQVIAASKIYIKEKYAKADIDIPQEVFHGRLNWLKERDIISESEYREMKIEYDNKKLL